MDVMIQDDLAGQNPFPDIPPARNRTSEFFGDTRYEDAVTAELKLTSRVVAEAVLRLPFCLRQYYLQALRLDERNPALDSSLQTLEEFITTRKHSSRSFRGCPWSEASLIAREWGCG
jgi:hypothetical protein